MTDHLLIVSAFAPELAWLRRQLRGARARGELARGRVSCEAVGVGLVESAHGAARAISRHAPDLVVFLGTAGAYGRAPAMGDVAIARDLVLASTAAARGDGYLPGLLPVTAGADASARRALLRAARATGVAAGPARVATTMAITRGRALAARLQRASGAAVENLEAFAVARAAAAARIPFAAVLGIANRVGPNAHAEWLANAPRAAEAAGRVALAFALDATATAPR